MKYVIFKRVKDDLTTESVMKVILVDDKIKVVPEEQYDELIGLLDDDEYIIGFGGKKYSMTKQPEEFLQNLKYAFSGSRFFATDIKE